MTKPLDPLKPHPRHRRYFTPDQIRKIRRLREDGVLLRVVADRFGISESAASRICSGFTYGPLPVGQTMPHRQGRSLTPGERAQIVARRRAGETYPSLARHFGISLSTAYRVVHGPGRRPR